jgi:hypothetical protein
MKKVPWYRDIRLSKMELSVGRTCVYCGEIIETDSQSRMYHPECFKKRRRDRYIERWRENHKFYQKKEQPKYCIDCGELIPKERWNIPHVKRCIICQYKRNQLNVKNAGKYRHGVVVAVTCVRCHELILTDTCFPKYCEKCKGIKKREKGILSTKEKRRIGEDYRKKIFGNVNTVNKLGTFVTSSRYGDVATMKRAEDGNISWDKERKHIDYLTHVTFRKRKD